MLYHFYEQDRREERRTAAMTDQTPIERVSGEVKRRGVSDKSEQTQS